jgi:filamentous hemagglutinin
VESAQSYAEASSSSKSWNAGVGLSWSLNPTSGLSSGLTAEGGFAKDKSRNYSLKQLNAHLTSQNGTATIKTGKDATFAGAVVKGPIIDVDVGGNLTVDSRQDQSHSNSSSSNGSVSVTFTPGGVPTSGSLSIGGGKGTSDMAWVREQSGFHAKDKLDVYVEKHTQLNGAVLNSETDQLKLDTGTLGFKDIKDYDKGTSVSGQVGISYTADSDKNGDGVVDKGSGGPGGSVSGGYASHIIEQDTKATVGKGEIIVRDKDDQKQDVAAINRDVEQSQVFTKYERVGVEAYGSSDAVKEIVSGYQNIRNNAEKIATKTFSLGAGIPEGVKEAIDGGKVSALELAYAVKALLSGAGGDEVDLDVEASASVCSSNALCAAKAKEIIAKWEQEVASRPELAQYAQSAGNIKKMGEGPLLAAAKANGYSSIHEMKADLGLNSRVNIGIDRNGNLYQMGVKAIYVPIPLGISASGK